MPTKKIKRNSARCLRCGDEIESKTIHDYRTCSCGAITVDGGKEYLRRAGDPELCKETSLFWEEGENQE